MILYSHFFRSLVLIALLIGFRPVNAEVLDSAAGGFSIQMTLQINKSPDDVYEALVKDIDQWWDSAHTFSGDSKNLSIDPRAGGCFCEKLPGGNLRHLTVVYADQGKLLRMTGGLGPLQEMAVTGSMTIRLKPQTTGTLLTFNYNVTGYSKNGLQAISGPVDAVLSGQMRRLKTFLESQD